MKRSKKFEIKGAKSLASEDIAHLKARKALKFDVPLSRSQTKSERSGAQPIPRESRVLPEFPK